MKLISYLNSRDEDELGLLCNDAVYKLTDLDKALPTNMSDLLFEGSEAIERAQLLNNKIQENPADYKSKLKLQDLNLLAPVPFPSSLRDAYAFRQHVAAGRKNRGLDMIPEFDQFPVFYFSNHNAVSGPGELEFMSDHFDKLDFELEVAIVIGKEGRNIKAEEADEYIAGFMIMNDFSARSLQMQEMKLNLGPAKGKDFCTSIGPVLVTPDELQDRLVEPKEGHTGNCYDLEMKAYVNGKKVSEGNMADMHWTFAEIIERCSYGVELLPGDVIGSGTVGTGCFLELNGTGKRLDENYKEQWLKAGDTISLEIEGLGRLDNIIKAEQSNFSIMKKLKT
ncbi:MAG: fumarylacetoacetate hydrolase family protein [Chitinophagales bacterium]